MTSIRQKFYKLEMEVITRFLYGRALLVTRDMCVEVKFFFKSGKNGLVAKMYLVGWMAMVSETSFFTVSH